MAMAMQCRYATARRNGQAIDLSWNSLNAKHIPTLMRSPFPPPPPPRHCLSAQRCAPSPNPTERSRRRRQRIGFSRRVLMPRPGHAPRRAGYTIQPG